MYTQYIIEIIPSILVGIFLAYFNYCQNKRHEEFDKKAKLRKLEGKLILDISLANAKMSYANSMAIIRGRHNGEVEEAVEEHQKVIKEYDDFIKANHISYMENNK